MFLVAVDAISKWPEVRAMMQQHLKFFESAPYHPASNGLVERFVQLLKNSLPFRWMFATSKTFFIPSHLPDNCPCYCYHWGAALQVADELKAMYSIFTAATKFRKLGNGQAIT